MNYHIPLEPNNKYHIFNQTVGKERMFRDTDNYDYFLKKFNEYISPIALTYSYVLIPNHFHFLIEIKSKDELHNHYKQREISRENENFKLSDELNYSDFIMRQFINFLNSYSKSYNKRFNRRGTLFVDYMKRVSISDIDYLRNLVLYIHQNPVHHNCCNALDEWKYSSFNAFYSAKPSKLEREEAISWFGDLENFTSMHSLKNINFNNKTE